VTMDDLQQAVGRLTAALERSSDELDGKLLRTIQKNTFLCSAKCCDNRSASRVDLQQCLERCSRPLMEAEQKVKVHFEEFQLRYQRCIQRCQDVAVENLSPSSSERDRARAEASLQKCAITCCSNYEKQIPQLQKNILNSMN